MAKQLPLTCPGHTRPVVHLAFSNITASGGYFLITACKGDVQYVKFVMKYRPMRVFRGPSELKC